MAVTIHVVSKRNIGQNATCAISADTHPLAAGSVRVSTELISVTTNNLTYARGGTALHWWDAYPVPDSAPAPFNDGEAWGIVPAWGYARVLESRISDLEPNRYLYGLWPMSPHPVDLRLEPVEPTGHWREASAHRSELMTMYNHFERTNDKSPPDATVVMAKTGLTAAFLLNKFVFAGPVVHPGGVGAPWCREDADLTSAAVVCLSAGSKTGRAFAWNLTRNRVSSSAPLALLQLSSDPDSLPRYPEAGLPTKQAKYDEPDAVAWLAGFHPERVVIVDFGAPKAVTDSVLDAAQAVVPSILLLAVGVEAKMYSPEELSELRQSLSAPNKVMLNTSAVRDRAIEFAGPAAYFRKFNEALVRYLSDWDKQKLHLKTVRGIEGTLGLEGLWHDLCNRRVPPNVGVTVHF